MSTDEKKKKGKNAQKKFKKDVLKLLYKYDLEEDNSDDDDEESTYMYTAKELVKIDQYLGGGNFGDVFKMTTRKNDKNTVVGAKRLKEQSSADASKEAKIDFLQEVDIFAYITSCVNKEKDDGKTNGHNNVLQLIGVYVLDKKFVAEDDFDSDWIKSTLKAGGKKAQSEQVKTTIRNMLLANPMVLTPFLTGQDVSVYMSKARISDREDMAITWGTMIKWADECSAGLAFLERNRIVHRDISARNIMLTRIDKAKPEPYGRDLTAVIVDYGLARVTAEDAEGFKDTGYLAKNQNRQLPFHYLAIEAFTEQNFTYASDMWGLGVALWEISIYCGRRPYKLEIPDLDQAQNKTEKLIHHFLPPSAFVEKNGTKSVKLDFDYATKGGKRLNLRNDMPSALKTIISKCWIAKGSTRITADQMQEELSKLKANEKIMANDAANVVKKILNEQEMAPNPTGFCSIL